MITMSMEQQLFFATFLWNKLHSLTAHPWTDGILKGTHFPITVSFRAKQKLLVAGSPFVSASRKPWTGGHWNPSSQPNVPMAFDQQQSQQHHHDTTVTWFPKIDFWNGFLVRNSPQHIAKFPQIFHGSDLASDFSETRLAESVNFRKGAFGFSKFALWCFLRKMWCAHISKRSHVLRRYGLGEVDFGKGSSTCRLGGANEREEGSCRQFNSNISKNIIKYTICLSATTTEIFPFVIWVFCNFRPGCILGCSPKLNLHFALLRGNIPKSI